MTRIETILFYALGAWGSIVLLYYTLDDRPSCGLATAQDAMMLVPVMYGPPFVGATIGVVRILQWLTKQ